MDINLIIGIILVSVSSMLGMYQMCILGNSSTMLYASTLLLFWIGIFIGSKESR